VVKCLERDADLHMAQLMPLPLTVSCFSKIHVGFTFLVPAHPVVLDKGPLNVCVYVCSCQKWVHKKCSDIKGSMSKVAKSYICSGC